MLERLQKILAHAGVASRRKAEELIVQGHVTINGERATELGVKADPERDTIKIRGKLLQTQPQERIYLALHKPKAYITSTEDPQGRRTVMDLLGRYRSKVYPVGRLDFHTEGLLLLTNDGEFANFVLSAKSRIPKTYQVKVNGSLTIDQLEKFRQGGIKLDGRPTAPAQIRLSRSGPNPWYTVTLTEGRNRQIRRMFQSLGRLVEKIRRTQIGPIKLAGLPNGAVRELTAREVERLRNPEAANISKRRRPTPRDSKRSVKPSKQKADS